MAGKIEYMKPYAGKDVKGILNPLVLEWFFSKFKDFSSPPTP